MWDCAKSNEYKKIWLVASQGFGISPWTHETGVVGYLDPQAARLEALMRRIIQHRGGCFELAQCRLCGCAAFTTKTALSNRMRQGRDFMSP